MIVTQHSFVGDMMIFLFPHVLCILITPGLMIDGSVCWQFALLETVMTAVQDTFPHLRQKKTWVVLFVCLSGFLGGLIICTQVRMMVVTGPFLISKVRQITRSKVRVWWESVGILSSPWWCALLSLTFDHGYLYNPTWIFFRNGSCCCSWTCALCRWILICWGFSWLTWIKVLNFYKFEADLVKVDLVMLHECCVSGKNLFPSVMEDVCCPVVLSWHWCASCLLCVCVREGCTSCSWWTPTLPAGPSSSWLSQNVPSLPGSMVRPSGIWPGMCSGGRVVLFGFLCVLW